MSVVASVLERRNAQLCVRCIRKLQSMKPSGNLDGKGLVDELNNGALPVSLHVSVMSG